MQVILTEDVPKLGNAGDVVRVRDGYARNYLLPRGMAMLATEGRVRELEHKKRVIQERQRKALASFEQLGRQISGVALEFDMLTREEGKLYGSVTNADVAAKLAELGFEVDRRKIDLPDPLRQVGEYDVPVRLHRDVVVRVAVKVRSVGAAPPEEGEAQVEETTQS
jgi:large subunit ribosomal protein L9